MITREDLDDMEILKEKLARRESVDVNAFVSLLTEDIEWSDASSFPSRRDDFLTEHVAGRRVKPRPSLSDYDRWTPEYLPNHEKVYLDCPFDDSFKERFN